MITKTDLSSPANALQYPFEKHWSPELAEPFEVCDGVFWLRTPLPMALDHINLWLLRDGLHWVIVDTGFDYPAAKQVWHRVFSEFVAVEQVSQIIVTHYHPDHIGLAAWLSHRCDCKVHISHGEFEQYRLMIDRDEHEFNELLKDYTREVGFSEQQAANNLVFMSAEQKPAKDRLQRNQVEIIKQGDQLDIDGSAWQVVAGNGHSPEHSCLYNESKGVLISGDQAIARISSNISVYPYSRMANPLSDWLNSCAKLRDNIPNNTLILPAHQEPFIGIAERMQALIDEHHAQLELLVEAIKKAAKRAINVSQACTILFDRKLSDTDLLFATGEALAHLNYLVLANKIEKQIDESGIAWYQLA